MCTLIRFITSVLCILLHLTQNLIKTINVLIIILLANIFTDLDSISWSFCHTGEVSMSVDTSTASLISWFTHTQQSTLADTNTDLKIAQTEWMCVYSTWLVRSQRGQTLYSPVTMKAKVKTTTNSTDTDTVLRSAHITEGNNTNTVKLIV